MACCITSDSSAVKEGGAVTFNLATTNVKAGTLVSYTLAGTNNAAGSSASGTFTVDGVGKASVTVVVPANSVLNDAGTLTLSAAGKTSTVSVTDATVAPPVAPVALDPTYSIASSSASVTEGGAGVIFTLSTTNVAAGTTIAYSVTGTGNAASQTTSGVFTVDSTGKAVSSAIAVPANSTYGDSGTLQLALSNGKATSPSISVKDATASPAAVDTTFTLTTGVDNMTGGAGKDTFNAANASGTAAAQTFNSSDVLDGGAGADILNVTVGSTATYALSNVSNIETVAAAFTAAGKLNLLGSSGVTALKNNGSSAAAEFTNIASTSVALSSVNTDQTAKFTFVDAAVAGVADSATLTLSNQTAGTITIAGVEILNIVSSGGDNTLTTLTADAATTINISGDTALDLGTANTVATSISSTNTSGVTIISNNSAAVAITGGAGADSITLNGGSSKSDNVSTGAGNDVIVVVTLDSTDSIDGGAGTDVLQSTSSVLTGYTAPSTPTISNIERFRVSDALGANLTTANIQTGVERVDLNMGTGGFTITMESGAKALGLLAAAGGSIVVADTGSAITDSLSLINRSTETDVYDGQALTVTGYETVSINTSTSKTRVSNDFGAISITPDSGGAVALNFTGNNSVTTTSITATSATSGAVDASGLTSAASFTNTSAVGISSITGSANADTIVGAATATTIAGGAGSDNITGGAAADKISGDAGNDTIDGAAGSDLLSGGEGNDSITAGAGSDTVLGGTGNDQLVFGDNLTSGDSIDGGDGTDTLSLSNTSLSTLTGLSIGGIVTLNDRISNVEKVTFSDALNQGTFDMARLDNISNVTLAGGFTGDETLTSLANNSSVTITAAPAASTDTLTLSLLDNTGSADSINYTMTNAGTADYGNLSVSGIETVNLTINEATATATVYTGTLGLTVSRTDGATTRAVTVNISGTENLTIDTAIGADVINASGLTGSLNMSSSTGSSLAQTITGGSGDDTLVGGGGTDAIIGGNGADVISGGTGADTLTGGLGRDTITGGAGNDSILLTEDVASVDRVVLDTSNSGADLDSITGFKTTSSGDNIAISIAGLNAAITGLRATATTLVNHAGTSITTAADSTYTSITTATTLTTSTVLGLRGTSLASTSDVEDALESGGAFEVTGSNAAFDTTGNSFIVVYTDGTDTYIAAAIATARTTDNVGFEAGDLTVVNLAKLIGVAAIGSTTFAAANFTFVS